MPSSGNSTAVNILIKATDSATAVFKKATAGFTASMQKAGATASAAFKKASGGVLGLAKQMLTLKGVVTGFVAGFASFAALHKALDVFAEKEEAAHELAEALKLNGENAAAAVPEMQAFAASIRATTTMSAGGVMKLVGQAARLKVPADQLKQVTQAAIGLSQILKIDQADALDKVNAAINGNFRSLGKLIPQIKNAANDQQKLAILNRFAADGFELAKGKTETMAGAMERLGNLTKVVMAKIGSVIGPVVKRFVVSFEENLPQIEAAIDSIAVWFSNMREMLTPIFDAIAGHIKRTFAVIQEVFAITKSVVAGLGVQFEGTGGIVQAVADGITAASKFMATAVITAFTAAEFAITNWRQILELAMVQGQLSLTTFVEDAKQVFGTDVPAVLKWFAEHWRDLLSTVMDFNNLVMQNIYENTIAALSQLYDAISAIDWKAAWNSFLDAALSIGRQVIEYFNGLFKDLYDYITNFDWANPWAEFTSESEKAIKKVDGQWKDPTKFHFTGLSGAAKESFDHLFDDFPQVFTRAETETEAGLAKLRDKLAGGLAGQFGGELEKRLRELDVRFNGALTNAGGKKAGEEDAGPLKQIGKAQHKGGHKHGADGSKDQHFFVGVVGNRLDPKIALARQQLKATQDGNKGWAGRDKKQDKMLTALEAMNAKFGGLGLLAGP